MSDYLDNIEQRANAASTGPWDVYSNSSGYCYVTGRGFDHIADDMSEANAEFIAHARDDVPKLVAVLKDLLAMHHDGGNHTECAYQEPDWRRQRCHHCGELYPCHTVRTITKALEVEP